MMLPLATFYQTEKKSVAEINSSVGGYQLIMIPCCIPLKKETIELITIHLAT
jgi:hypothetical protein